MEQILLKLDEGMLERIDELVKKHNYSTRTEFIRESVRSKVRDLEHEEALKQVLALRGSLKGKITEEEFRKHREKVAKEYMKEHGLK